MSEKIETPTHRMTRQEFYAWVERQPTSKFELVDGQVVAMAPERAGHARMKLRVCNAFAEAIRARNLPCEAFIDGLAVEVGESTAYEPDVVVNCGTPVGDESIVAPRPVIVVEVTSPSTSRIDQASKFADYLRLPCLHHYLIVHLGKRIVIHHRRDEHGRVESAILSSGSVTLDPPGIELDVGRLFSV